MKSVRRTLFSRRNILGILIGVFTSLVLVSWMRNYILASILGMMVTLIIADLRQPTELAMLGLVTGSMAGLYRGVRNYLISGEVPINTIDKGLIISVLGGLILTGLICASYGFILGKIFRLYNKGQRVFF